MFGGFITGEVSENKHRHANRKDAQHDRSLSDSIINDKSLTRAEKLAMWKKVRGQRSRRETNPPAPQATGTNDVNDTLRRSKRVLGNIKPRIDTTKRPFEYAQGDKKSATEVLLSRSGLGKSGMFSMTFSPGNGHSSKITRNTNKADTSEDVSVDEPSATEEDTTDLSSIRIEDLAISQTNNATESDEKGSEAEKEEINALQKQLREASERMEDLEQMCKLLESTCGEKDMALVQSTQNLEQSQVKVQELSDELAKQKSYEDTIQNLRDELDEEKLGHDKTLKKLDTAQRTYRKAEKAATVMEKAMSKLRAKVEANVSVQKETSKMLQSVQDENASMRKKIRSLKKQHASEKQKWEEEKNEAVENAGNMTSQQVDQIMKERDDFKKLVEKLTIENAKISTSRDNFESKFNEAKLAIKEKEEEIKVFAQKEEESKALVEKSKELEAKCKELVQNE